MSLEISFRHLDHTESIDEKIREKITRLQSRHFSETATFKWTSWVENHEHITSFHAYDKGKEYFVKASSDNLYKTIDMAIKKMESQVEHHGHH